MRLTAEAVTQCKFEATDPAADEVVLFKILQARLVEWLPWAWLAARLTGQNDVKPACRCFSVHVCFYGAQLVV